jgi:Flp pilus assembly pilin Flp
MLSDVKRCRDSERGATSIEYTLIAAPVSIAIITALDAVGTTLNTAFFSAIAGTINNAIGA